MAMQLKFGCLAITFVLVVTGWSVQARTELNLTADGLGDLGRDTAFSVEAVSKALPGYSVTQEKYFYEMGMLPMIVVRDSDEVIVKAFRTSQSDKRIYSLFVLTDRVLFDGRTSVGMTYADLSTTVVECEAAVEERLGQVLCRDGKVSNVWMFFEGEREDLSAQVPPLDVLETFTVREITWVAEEL